MTEIRVSPSPHDPDRWVWWENAELAEACGVRDTLPATHYETVLAGCIIECARLGMAPGIYGRLMWALLARRPAPDHSGTPVRETRQIAHAVRAAGTPRPAAHTVAISTAFSMSSLRLGMDLPRKSKGAVGAAPLFVSPTSADLSVSDDGETACEIPRQKRTETFPQ